LAHGQQFLATEAWSAIGRDPRQHLGGAVQPSPPPQGEQLGRGQASAEMGSRFTPGPGMQRLGVEQQTVEVEQASGGSNHAAILNDHRPGLLQQGLWRLFLA
jgi:hypothetical protein